ncbi:DUF2130 domain-containing protein [Candidatus Woesebacteria bacterium]|jgi:hypothetical protein|nr:DUF2130 domain-containing protein [Candidatus Woesebacteria bacterium]MBP6882997.1 DUF2130 domain-containing protein [Candidatus Woesebacteria bacterium]
MNDQIICPKCGESISITDAMSYQFKEKLLKEGQEQGKKTLSGELEYLKSQNLKKDQELEVTRRESLELRKEKDRLDEDKKAWELQKMRDLEQAKDEIRKKAIVETDEKNKAEILRANKINDDLTKKIRELELKATSQGSQQLKGEVRELDLQKDLALAFSTDLIEEVPKGINGADIKQTVITQRGSICGIILWEVKEQKAWKDEWISKLKEDQRVLKATLPIIVTSVMPKDAKKEIFQREGVWICSFNYALLVAEMTREKLVEVAKQKFISQHKGTRAEAMYEHVMGPDFRSQLEGLFEYLINSKRNLDKERRAINALMDKREEDLNQFGKNMSRLSMSIASIAGPSFPQIKGLELLESGEEKMTEQ